MRTFLIIAFVLGLYASSSLQAQCTPLSINDLQVIQSADPSVKHGSITNAGFDLRNIVTKGGVVSQVYSRCWFSTVNGQMIFEQRIIWDQTNDTVKFLTFNEGHFQDLRRQLDEKHPAGVGQTVVVGQRFKYLFGADIMDGREYHSLLLSFR